MIVALCRLARERLVAARRNGRQQVIYLITDGSSDDSQRTLAEAMLTKEENIHIIVVVVGDWFNMQVLFGWI